MDNQNNSLISNIIMDSIRILILISKFEVKKTFKLTMDKIMLYDYYMKFPNTMINTNNLNVNIKYDFYEYYSFYHWKPIVSEYNKVLRYLISKGFIECNFDKKVSYYMITNMGNEFLGKLSSMYKESLEVLSDFVKNNISKKSDSEVENEILMKTGIINRFGGEEYGKTV
ncbi:ABC-three component system middle component 2 [Clostridium ljungdahlii]|uniref:ABC-three component system middle component 2 n=1 Tax=Clostridium ljungdahlii TaxID=1538 RepID=UPI0009EDD5C3|nr:ABC-three component system middle component 2 [Clostridium ljungdahlii]